MPRSVLEVPWIHLLCPNMHHLKRKWRNVPRIWQKGIQARNVQEGAFGPASECQDEDRIITPGACMLSRVRLCNPMDGSLPGSSVHGMSQARILEWVYIPFFRGSSPSRGGTLVSCISCTGKVDSLPLATPGLPCYSPCSTVSGSCEQINEQIKSEEWKVICDLQDWSNLSENLFKISKCKVSSSLDLLYLLNLVLGSCISSKYCSVYFTHGEIEPQRLESVSWAHFVGWVRNLGFKSQLQRQSSVFWQVTS